MPSLSSRRRCLGRSASSLGNTLGNVGGGRRAGLCHRWSFSLQHVEPVLVDFIEVDTAKSIVSKASSKAV
uniref:Uncharacterized protein n=1 Tax=Setaria viridis TaxID=4556 RepID=A0A4U6VZR4_SETVI|nr:hypothetical protein SEVIR_2G348650v2 [Setaria viridis]